MKAVRVLVAACGLLLLMTICVRAAEPKELTGTVTIKEDKRGRPESMSIKTSDGTFELSMAGKARALAAVAADEQVWIKGVLSTRRDKKADKDITTVSVNDFAILLEGPVTVERDGTKVKAIKVGDRALEVNSAAKKMAEEADGKTVTAQVEKELKASKKKGEEPEVELTLRSYTLKGDEAVEEEKKKEH